MKTVDYFGTEKMDLSGFCKFCKNNVPLIISVTIGLFFSYGIKLVCYSIGIDTELLLADKASYQKWIVQIGRFGSDLLHRFWYIHEFNPVGAFFITFCFIWLFTISWSYCLSVFGKNTGRNNKLIPFALLFMTMPVWAEQFYFVCQSAETACMIFLCPYVIYLLYQGFLHNEKGKVICAFTLLVLMISVYQAIIVLFCAGVFACFVLLQEHSDYEPQVYRLLCLKLFITVIAALAAYFLLDKLFVTVIFNTEKSEYLDNMNLWGKEPIIRNILRILLYGYILTIGHIPIVQSVAEPVMAQFARTGMELAKEFSRQSRIIGNVLLFPAALCFIIQISKMVQGKIVAGRRILYILAGIGIPFSIMLLSIISGNIPPIRSMYALPFASAFMIFYLITKYKKPISSVIAGIALLVSVYQAQTTAQLFYSDYLRYQEDVRLAFELDRSILRLQDDTEKLPIAFIGKYKIDFKTNFLPGGVLGHSFFGWPTPDYVFESTKRGLAFMQSLGINYESPDENQMNQARLAAEPMPSYPATGSVKRLSDLIVVKFSESMYVETK
ncbi:MAG: glucosyltransferase domain-containing protein [Treponema sp.]|nr:glucosyltransferase domain-containing protein [Treponema sp.]